MRRVIMVVLCTAALAGCRKASAGNTNEQKSGATQAQTIDNNMRNKNLTEKTVNAKTDTVENANGRGTTTLSDMGDRKFVEKAASGGMAEVELGKLALDKASAPEVRQFAQKMVDDHSKANEELKQLSLKKNFPLPNDIDTEQKQELQKLSKKSGKDFDKAYMETMVKDHDQDVKDFKNEASQAGADPEIKAWAQRTLQVLEEHDKLAHQDKGELKSGKKSK